MTDSERQIASVLQEITMEARPPGPLDVVAWRRGRRHRLMARSSLAIASAVVIAVAGLVIHRAANNEPAPRAAAPIELRSSLVFRQVAAIDDKPCPAHSHGVPGWPDGAGDSPVPGEPSTYCFHLTGPTITVRTLKYARIASDTVTLQLRMGLPSREADRLAALSKDLIHQPAPRNQLAIIVAGRVITAPMVVAKIPSGRFWLRVATRSYAEHLLRQLRVG